MLHLLTTAEAAERLGVTVMTISRWVRLGILVPAFVPPTRNGGRAFYPDDIERLAAEREGASA